MKKKQLDMLHGSLWNKIPIFARDFDSYRTSDLKKR